MDLSRERDPEILRQAVLILERENGRLIRRTLELSRENERLRGKDPKALELQLRILEEQLSKARQKIFGRSSEKLPVGAAGCERAPQRGHGPSEQPELPVVEQIHELDEPDRMCPKCGSRLLEWPEQYEESDEIAVVERRFVLTRHKRKKYRCTCQSCVETAPGPVKLFPGARYSPGFAVHVAVAKYADHLPLERQVRMMARSGLRVTSQTLWDQIHALKTVCEPLHDAIWRDVLSSPVVYADETPWRMLKNNRSGRWYIWGVSSDRSACYRILDSRSAEAGATLLSGYQGTVVADGYSAYGSLARDGPRTVFRLANCWAHARRYFYEVRDYYPEACGWFLDRIGELYAVERAVPATANQVEALQLRRELRMARSRAVVESIRARAIELLPSAAARSGLSKALGYRSTSGRGSSCFSTTRESR